jgi:hypothetical protein
MKIVKNILIGLGCLFGLFIVITVFLSFKSSSFKNDYSPFVSKFMTEFSENWDVGDIQYMLSNDFLEQIETPNSRQAMAKFRQLGKIQQIQEIELTNYRSNVGDNSFKLGEFVFKADFENASGLVTMIVIVKNGGERVQGLNINPTTEISRVPTKTSI